MGEREGRGRRQRLSILWGAMIKVVSSTTARAAARATVGPLTKMKRRNKNDCKYCCFSAVIDAEICVQGCRLLRMVTSITFSWLTTTFSRSEAQCKVFPRQFDCFYSRTNQLYSQRTFVRSTKVSSFVQKLLNALYKIC